MLVLARKKGAKVFILPNIVVLPTEITRGKVRIAIKAPGRPIRRDDVGQLDNNLDTQNQKLEGTLTLSRKTGERIFIGDDITLTVVEIRTRENKVRIGFEAPPDIKIFREELLPIDQRPPELR